MIRKLPQSLINKIAAGEVVERPASVVKELVENALDAGAGTITVSIRGGAVGGMEVADDGCGMSEEDALLCIEHHATSKIESEKDLAGIATLGFRGEALSSIAAVSRFTLITRPKDRDAGVRVTAEAGRIRDRQPSASPPGTRVKVEDLFFNVPARLKFLKSVRTEESLVAETVRNLALTCPGVAFRHDREGREVLALPAADEAQRVEQAMKGRKLAFMAGEGGPFILRAYLTPPEKARRGASGLILVVNGRVVTDRAVAGAVAAAHEGLLERGRYPEGVIYLQLPPEDLDVNVHPQKREIRFSDSRALFGFIRKTVSESLSRSPWLPPPPARPAPRPAAAETQASYGSAARPLPMPLPYSGPSVKTAPRPAHEAPRDEEAGGFFSGAAVLGQLFSTYILCEKEDDLLVIDQHAAAERITYEKLRDQVRRGGVALQALLLPCVVPMDEKDVAAAEENEGLLRTLGIDAGPSGPDSMTVRAVPALLGNVDPAALLRESVDRIRSLRARTDEAVEAVLQTMACHGSVRAGRRLEPDEIRALLAAMDRVDFAAHCPHGRPVYFTLSRRDIETRLRRS